jgi:hypothetical protein
VQAESELERAPYLDRPCQGGRHFTLGYRDDEHNAVWICPNDGCRMQGKKVD